MLLFFVYEQSQLYNIFLIYQDIVCGDFHPNIFICIKIYYRFNKNVNN